MSLVHAPLSLVSVPPPQPWATAVLIQMNFIVLHNNFFFIPSMISYRSDVMNRNKIYIFVRNVFITYEVLWGTFTEGKSSDMENHQERWCTLAVTSKYSQSNFCLNCAASEVKHGKWNSRVVSGIRLNIS